MQGCTIVAFKCGGGDENGNVSASMNVPREEAVYFHGSNV